MRFKVIVGEETFAVEVPEDMLQDGTDFFARMDRDMDKGCQMSRDYVECPDQLERCQIVADKLLTNIMNQNETAAMLMAAYIIKRMPGVAGVDVDTTGEIQNTELLYV